jgi:two-component system, OmpR family, phosphate regulon response regulator PhoB
VHTARGIEMASILIVEDETALIELLRYNLEAAGYAVRVAPTGSAAEEALIEQRFDLVLLDWMLPEVPGIELCRRIRQRPETRNLPIIMLTARGEEVDRVRGLSTGADDYVVKPFSINEVLARVKALIRRASPDLVADVLTFADIALDRAAHRVTRGDRDLRLGPTEFKLMLYLLENRGRVLTRQQVIDGVWGRDGDVDERTVDVHIGRLRKAMVRDDESDPIRTVRGGGYVFGEK